MFKSMQIFLQKNISTFKKIFRKFTGQIKQVNENKIVNYRLYLDRMRPLYNNYSDVLFVMQVFNSADTLTRCLEPFLKERIKNFLLFSDCCQDGSSQLAINKLKAPFHFVMNTNDLHEIHNYRLALPIASHLGCKYMILLQDDDYYSCPRLWIESALIRLNADPSIAILGMCGGMNLTEKPPVQPDDGFAKALWWSSESSGHRKCGLGHYYEYYESNISATPDCSNWRYVATVNRAPQAINVEVALKIGFFPADLEPYQYDDDYNCFNAWLNGYKVVHAPLSGKSIIRVGGMRRFNAVTPVSRPSFHGHNYKYVLDRFGEAWSSGLLQKLVDSANDKLWRAER
jgi:hypothetical protein